MRNKKIILLVIIILVLILGVFGYWQYKLYNVRKEVLSYLEENLEFCQIVKDNVSFNGGEFWLICNTRPFYAVYDKGKINYELNGWGFLKEQPEILADLQSNGCQFYTALPENTLIFSCQNKRIRRYTFSLSDFRFSEIKPDATSFLNLLSESPRHNYEELVKFSEAQLDEEKFLKIEAAYGEHNVKFFFSSDKLYFTLPTVVDENLSTREKADLSFQLIERCQIGSLDLDSDYAILIMDCNEVGEPMINYDFNLGFANFLFNEEDFRAIFPYFAKYNFPFLKPSGFRYLTSEEDEINKYSYYLFGERVLIAQSLKNSTTISKVYLKAENLQ